MSNKEKPKTGITPMFYSIKETAILLGVCTSTVRNEIRAGKLKIARKTKKSGKIMIYKESIYEYNENRTRIQADIYNNDMVERVVRNPHPNANIIGW
jgi:predicted site-specific integrase-resolvase